MNTQTPFKERYVALLRGHIGEPAEEYLAAAADLGRELLLADVPIEDVVQIHQETLLEVGEEFSASPSVELINQAFGPLMEMFMAYSLAMRERAQEHERARRSDQQLIEAQNAELQQEIVERKQAQQELEDYAARLEAANEELEAFSYSVSHDLRAPLRGMDGFSQVLLEDYADQFDEQGKDYLQRVRTASQRMGRLIDDLLELSRVTHSKMRVEGIDLSEIAEQSAAELRQPEPDRQVEFVIAPGLVVEGDEPLLRAVVQELLVNAWKYTSQQQHATIEFGATQQDGKTVYFVRDDGIGFDMAYADKLFGAFQRLHSDEQFPGTGIGLATVQRIIHRHGGRVWAQATEDEGAIFYFTVQLF